MGYSNFNNYSNYGYSQNSPPPNQSVENYTSQTTPIEEILDLDDVPSQVNNTIPSGAIRNTNNNMYRQEMNNYNKYPSYTQSNYPPKYNTDDLRGDIENPYLNNISCIDFNRHVESCPICSKFYNTDKTIYFIIITILVVICLLLLKRVIEM